ncbi:alpha-mannosyltransferase [Ascoidea rubescens DSM 1968]|uniref:Glycosyltransferase family 71 protein n=1 Tax=Ascoidea rubescens DSM 1968 TaxID=1344418 RepID=A0A1D2VRL8_9ASCO|nr:glycosyltransferase family 71 protein [Ascoidea rubescens DSM 1968]ODV64254.1 glycosyltransferase family 71 protein [Ascoidea rubescens DSM 1968]
MLQVHINNLKFKSNKIKKNNILYLSTLVLVFLVYSLLNLNILHLNLAYSYNSSLNSLIEKNDQNEFFNQIFKLFALSKPDCLKLSKYKKSPKEIDRLSYEKTEGPILSEYYLSKFLQLSKKQYNDLLQSHNNLVNNLPHKNLLKNKNFYKGNGIVFVGGDDFNWLNLLSIKFLRNMGSNLPIEIFIPNLTYSPNDLFFCENILPQYNAECILLSSYLNEKTLSTFSFKGYQYKSLALLFSSFENVLLLDSDNLPVKNPDYIFKNSIFKEKGLFIWPDYWKRTTSPFFYKIANLKILNKRVRFGYNNIEKIKKNFDQDLNSNIINSNTVPFHDREGSIPNPTSESGQILINKSSHFNTILLSLYYNIFGPEYYYPLLSQGTSGQGDKETFLCANIVLGNSYFQIKEKAGAIGQWIKDSGEEKLNFFGHGIAQNDPIEEYLYEHGDRIDKANVMFIHANYPKMNPFKLVKEKLLKYHDGKNYQRFYGHIQISNNSIDFELQLWSVIKSLLNDYKYDLHKLFEDFDGKNIKLRDEVLKQVDEFYNYLEKTSKLKNIL